MRLFGVFFFAGYLWLISSCISTSSASKVANACRNGLSKDKTIFNLLPSMRKKYLIPDLQDVIEKYNATTPNSDERKRFVEDRKDVITSINSVCLFLGDHCDILLDLSVPLVHGAVNIMA